MTPAEMFRRLAALGLNTDQMAGVLEIIEADAETRKEKGRERWRKWKDGKSANVSKRLPTTANVNSTLAGAEDSSSKEDTTGKENKEAAPVARGDLEAFKAELSSVTDELRIAAIVKHRRAKKAQMTAHAARLFIADAAACGISIAEAIDTCISRNWITVKPDWLAKRQSTAPPKGKTVGDIFREDAQRMGIIPNDKPTPNPTERLDASNRDGQDGSTGIARRFALPANVVGRIG